MFARYTNLKEKEKEEEDFISKYVEDEHGVKSQHDSKKSKVSAATDAKNSTAGSKAKEDSLSKAAASL